MDKTSQLLIQLVRIGSIATASTGCFLFLPSRFPDVAFGEDLSLFAGWSVERFNEDAFVTAGSGAIGWVSKHEEPIQSQMFENELGTELYRNEPSEREIIAFPVPIQVPPGTAPTRAGVVIADRHASSVPYTSREEEILAGLARHISSVLALWRDTQEHMESDKRSSWEHFLGQVRELRSALGDGSLEVIRMRSSNFAAIEKQVGTADAVAIVEQFERLVAQALPPQFPLFRLPDGDLLIVFDKMMRSFFEAKLNELNRATGRTKELRYVFQTISVAAELPLQSLSSSSFNSSGTQGKSLHPEYFSSQPQGPQETKLDLSNPLARSSLTRTPV